jgi:hypothetical protein
MPVEAGNRFSDRLVRNADQDGTRPLLPRKFQYRITGVKHDQQADQKKQEHTEIQEEISFTTGILNVVIHIRQID